MAMMLVQPVVALTRPLLANFPCLKSGEISLKVVENLPPTRLQVEIYTSTLGQNNQEHRLQVLGHSLVRLLICSDCSLVCLLRTTRFARLLTALIPSLVGR